MPGLVLALLAASLGAARAQHPPAGPPPSVAVAPVVVRDVAPAQTFIGRVMAIQAVQIVPRVTAFVQDVPVQQGSDVKAGDVLYRLDPSQYDAALQAARAQLASANAALRLAQLTYDRTSHLTQRNVETRANLDQAQATRDQNQANVQAAQANLAQAQLNLSYCTITSPIAGRIGAITLTKGNLVTPSTPPLATVNQLDPIRVVFSVSDRLVISAQQREGQPAATIAQGLSVNIELPDGSTYPQAGRIAFLGNAVDQATGTVSVYADFANPRELLLPGGFVTIGVHRATPEQRPLVPVAAIQRQQSGTYVLAVGPDDKVEQRSVQLGRQIGQDYVVMNGLSGGERVIVEGVQKVQPGESVKPVENSASPQEPGTTGTGQNAPSDNGDSR
jgi:membrane fusion protein (multidrug efflux system)